MILNDEFRKSATCVHRIGRTLYSNGSSEYVEERVLVEHCIDVWINGRQAVRIVCTPDNLVDMIIGRLRTEGFIGADGMREIEEIHIAANGAKAEVTLSSPRCSMAKSPEAHGEGTLGADANQGIRTLDTCGSYDFSGEGTPSMSCELDPVRPIPWRLDWVFEAARVFSQDSPLHKRTFGTHSCYVINETGIVCCREDIGRHNAFDKAIGAAMLKGADLSQSLIFSSGRIPLDMVKKAIRSGIPVLATKAVPTNATIDLARQYNLTLICSAHPDSVVVYNNPTSAPLESDCPLQKQAHSI